MPSHVISYDHHVSGYPFHHSFLGIFLHTHIATRLGIDISHCVVVSQRMGRTRNGEPLTENERDMVYVTDGSVRDEMYAYKRAMTDVMVMGQ